MAETLKWVSACTVQSPHTRFSMRTKCLGISDFVGVGEHFEHRSCLKRRSSRVLQGRLLLELWHQIASTCLSKRLATMTQCPSSATPTSRSKSIPLILPLRPKAPWLAAFSDQAFTNNFCRLDLVRHDRSVAVHAEIYRVG